VIRAMAVLIIKSSYGSARAALLGTGQSHDLHVPTDSDTRGRLLTSAVNTIYGSNQSTDQRLSEMLRHPEKATYEALGRSH
jgi:hypothetical protein